jgi:branched-chain amino acid aminotransferase
MNFTLEFLQSEILILVNKAQIQNSSRVRLTVFRVDGGFYLPTNNNIAYTVTATYEENKTYKLNSNNITVDLYKDFLVSNNLLSTLKTNNKILHITASIFAKENNYNTCLLLNENKNIVEAINGNIFICFNDSIITPPITEGCLNGVMRKQIIKIINEIENLEVIVITDKDFTSIKNALQNLQ